MIKREPSAESLAIKSAQTILYKLILTLSDGSIATQFCSLLVLYKYFSL